MRFFILLLLIIILTIIQVSGFEIFNIKPAMENKPAPPLAGKSKNSWFNGLIKSFKNKVIALSAHKNEVPKMVKLPRAEEIKPVVAKPPTAPRPLIKQEA